MDKRCRTAADTSKSVGNRNKVRCGKKQISRALLTAKGLLRKDRKPAAKVASVLNPYMQCSEVEGVIGQVSDDMRSSVFAVMGDAYRREGNLELAARWYRRASQISAADHAAIYAHIVARHQLAQFYEDALRTIEEHQRRWHAKPLSERFFLRLGMWLDGERRVAARRTKRDLEFLRQHAVPQAA